MGPLKLPVFHVRFFSHCSDRSDLRKERLILAHPGVPSTIARKVWWQEVVAAGHIVSTAKSRETWMLVFNSLSPFVPSGTLTLGTVPPMFRVGLSAQLSLSGNTLTDPLRVPFP